jgi:hypothetical protein
MHFRYTLDVTSAQMLLSDDEVPLPHPHVLDSCWHPAHHDHQSLVESDDEVYHSVFSSTLFLEHGLVTMPLAWPIC